MRNSGKGGAGQMSQQLKAALTEDPGSGPLAHAGSQPYVVLVPGDPMPSPVSAGTCTHVGHIKPCRHMHIK